MSRTIKQATALGLAVILCCTLASCSLLPKEEEALKPPLVKPAQENYTTVEVTSGTLVKEVNGSGIFEALEMEHSQFTGEGGRVQEILVNAGDNVKRGDVLVQLILDGLDLKVKEQQLALERAKYAYMQARNGDEQSLKMAGLQVEIEQIKYTRLSSQLGNKQLIANRDGQVIFSEDLKEGDYIEAYQTLVTVADTTKLRIAIRIDNPNDIQTIQLGVSAAIKLNNEEVTGKVVQTPFSSPTTTNRELAEKNAKNIYIEVPKLPEGTRIGSMADVKIITQKRENVVKIPRSGLRSYLGRNFVRVIEEGKQLREIDVEPGLVGSVEVEIVKGLEAGQLVVLQ